MFSITKDTMRRPRTPFLVVWTDRQPRECSVHNNRVRARCAPRTPPISWTRPPPLSTTHNAAVRPLDRVARVVYTDCLNDVLIFLREPGAFVMRLQQRGSVEDARKAPSTRASSDAGHYAFSGALNSSLPASAQRPSTRNIATGVREPWALDCPMRPETPRWAALRYLQNAAAIRFRTDDVGRVRGGDVPGPKRRRSWSPRSLSATADAYATPPPSLMRNRPRSIVRAYLNPTASYPPTTQHRSHPARYFRRASAHKRGLASVLLAVHGRSRAGS
ncbi:hypothetical protein C8Q77DRAFT_1105771 [Trametes polyzona]|nr:hypothetical protein C8Q77DRAFT_1105771 [Trametes polyzona]